MPVPLFPCRVRMRRQLWPFMSAYLVRSGPGTRGWPVLAARGPLSDERLRLLGEVLGNLRSHQMGAWEDAFEQQLLQMRRSGFSQSSFYCMALTNGKKKKYYKPSIGNG